MNPKTLFIILGVLVVLFIAGVATGLGSSDKNSQNFSPGWLTSLGDSLFKEQRLKTGDLLSSTTPACRNQFTASNFTLNPAEACNLYIASSNAPVRQVNLRLVQGNSANVTFVPYDENQITAKYDMTPQNGKNCKTVSIYKKGGWLNINCTTSGSACRLEVVSTCQ